MRELSARCSTTPEQQIPLACHSMRHKHNEPVENRPKEKTGYYSVYFDMCPMVDAAVMKQHNELDTDYLVLASIETSSSDDESESDEGDVFSVSCHGSHFKQLKEQPKQCDQLAVKRRKLHTQLNLLNSDLMSMTFSGSGTSPDQPPCGFVPDKRARKVPRNKRLSQKIHSIGSKTRRISPRTA